MSALASVGFWDADSRWSAFIVRIYGIHAVMIKFFWWYLSLRPHKKRPSISSILSLRWQQSLPCSGGLLLAGVNSTLYLLLVHHQPFSSLWEPRIRLPGDSIRHECCNLNTRSFVDPQTYPVPGPLVWPCGFVYLAAKTPLRHRCLRVLGCCFFSWYKSRFEKRTCRALSMP